MVRRYFFIIIFLLAGTILFAEEVAVSWEFNTDGDSEGWTKSFGVSEMTVEEGMLVINTANPFPTIIGSEEINITSEDYGYIYVRMQAIEATEIRIYWQKSDSSVVFIPFSHDLIGDSLFHEYRIPIFSDPEWSGEIISLAKIQIGGPLTFAGKTVKIDYIRIVGVGVKPEIVKLVPIRTILKSGHVIPLTAIIENTGDKTGEMSSNLILPDGIELISGFLQNDHGLLLPGDTNTLHWEIRNNSVELDTINLVLYSEKDTATIEEQLNFTDQYWRQDEFLLSAWSPPYAWYGQPYEDTVFTYYKNANFDNMFWVRDENALMQKVQQHDLKYFLLITNIIGGDYLRAPDEKTPPDVTEEMLQKLDVVVDKYIDDPNLLGYHICDEPYEPAFPNIGKVVGRLREKDPTRLSFVNIWPSGNGYEEYIDALLQTAKLELLSYDRYHFFNDRDGGSYFGNLETIRRLALKYDIPFCNIIQAIGTNGTVEEDLDWRTPNEAEHRFLVYSSLAYGVHALIWFHWHLDWGLTGNPDRDIIYPSIQNINAEIDSLKQIMLHLTTTEVYQTKPAHATKPLPSDGIVKSVSDEADLVVGYFKDSDTNDYFMLMNKKYSGQITAIITLNGLVDDLKYFDVDSSKWVYVNYSNNGDYSEFEVTLRPGGGKLFAIGNLTVGIQSEKDLMPYKYNLMQNYPNPFNPASQINYEIANESYVKLIIYDALGREVKTLVNSQQKPGRYSIKFNASGFSSGIYFYRLISDEFSQTKKMLLIR